MGGDGQMELDTRSDAERDLEERTAALIEHAYVEMADRNPISSRHEGYGILAEKQTFLAADAKNVNDDMKDYLKILAADDNAALSAVNKLEQSLAQTVMAAIRMAAEARRVAEDLFFSMKENVEKTPVEELMDGFEKEEDE